MRNFLQFIIPIGIILIVGIVYFVQSGPESVERKLYIKCNSISEKKEVYSTHNFIFSEKNETCKLDVLISNVGADHVKIVTPYLLKEDYSGNINEEMPEKESLIPANEKVNLYSLDQEVKYIFEYK